VGKQLPDIVFQQYQPPKESRVWGDKSRERPLMASRNIQQIQMQLNQNISKCMDRGDRLDALCDKSYNLSYNSKAFNKKSGLGMDIGGALSNAADSIKGFFGGLFSKPRMSKMEPPILQS